MLCVLDVSALFRCMGGDFIITVNSLGAAVVDCGGHNPQQNRRNRVTMEALFIAGLHNVEVKCGTAARARGGWDAVWRCLFLHGKMGY